jgi:ribosome-associated protein
MQSSSFRLETWRDLLISTLEEKNGHHIKWIPVGSIFPLADYFIIASATSTRHLWTLCDGIERICRTHKIRPTVQGRVEDTEWIVMDARGIFIHLFLESGRAYFQLEELWDLSSHTKPPVESFNVPS